MNARAALVAVVGVCLGLSASVRAAEEKKRAAVDSRTPFVHRIPLLKQDGTAINPTKDTVPYSPAATCGKCHDYATINHGWHFNANQPDVKPGRQGEPWMLLDPTTRTQLPLSYRGWAGTFRPADVGMSDWDFTTHFAPHLPGGGVAEHPTTQPADRKALWPLSGKLQNDCMICHDGGNNYSTADRELQLKQMNFAAAPTRALGLGKISGSVASIVEEAEGEGTDPLKSTKTPKVAWDVQRHFDPEMRVHLNITRNTPSSKCYFCHTTNVVGPGPVQQWHSDKDVHLASGLSCTDCHRHGMDHDVVRGYESEGKEANDDTIAAYSCRGCHMGVEKSAATTVALGGKMGAPYPEHKGLPPVHLEKLACTACHSGPFPGEQPAMVQTAFAHELGLESFHRTPQSQPRILAPVFLRGADGKIAPHKVVWPTYWGRLNGEKVAPIAPDNVKKAARKDLPNVKDTDANAWTPLTDEQIGKVLTALAAAKDAGEPVYISGGLIHRLVEGKVTAAEHAAAKPYAWPVGHDVRPASQALGARGCADCHSSDSPIYFGQVTAQGPISQQVALTKTMFELRGDNGLLAQLFAWSFNFRTMLKVISFGSAGILAGLLVLYGLRGLGWVSSRLR